MSDGDAVLARQNCRARADGKRSLGMQAALKAGEESGTKPTDSLSKSKSD